MVSSVSLVSQPIVDSIKYVEPDQSIIIVHLNEDISYTATFPLASPDWVVYHNGTAYPAVFVRSQGALDPPNIIRLSLGTAITYDEAHTGTGITVEYLGTGPAINGTTGVLAAFGPTQAINNLPMECEMFDPSRFDYSLALTEICAPAEVEYTVAYYIGSHYINSQNYNPNLITIRTYWQDGSPRDETYGAEISPGKFEVTFSHTFPDDPSVCYWETYIAPGIGGIGYCYGGGLRKTFTYENHSTDDEGDGIFEFNIDTIRVCLGQDFTEIFTDATYFNCNPQTEPDFANDGERAVRFTYGTNFSPEPRIQDILVDGNPLGTPIVGPVVFYDSIMTNGVPAPSGWESSDPISHAFNPGTDAVGQVFEIQMENWGPCNNIYLGEPPIITYSYIKIVDGPIANAGPDFTICADDDAVMNGAIERTATAGVWSTNSGDGSWTNPNFPSGAIYTPGANDIINGGVWLVLTADDGAAGCPEHQDSMYLSIDPVITNNTLADNNESFCDNGDPSLINGSAGSGGDGDLSDDYQWQIRTTGGWSSIPGATTQDYDPDPITQTTRYRRVINSGECSSTSNVITVEVYEPPTGDAGAAQTICSNTTATLNGSIGGGASSATWTTSGDGSFDDPTDLSASYDPGPNDISSGSVTLTLTTNDPTGPCTPVSEDVIITVIEDVTVDAGPAGEVCSSDTYTLSGATLSGDYSSITWSTSGDGSFNNTGNLNPIYTPGANDITNGSVQLTISVDSDAPCGDKTDNMTLTVNEQPIVSAGSSPTVCEGSSYTVNDASALGDYTALTWTTSGDGSFTAGQGTLTPTYLPGTTDAANGNVTLTLTATAAGSCTDNDDDMIITIEPAVDPGIIAGSQSLCFGEDAAPLTSTAPATGVALTYQWYKAPAENGPYGAMIGENSATLDEGAMAVGSYYYFRRAYSAGICPPEDTDTLSIIVNPGPPPAPLNPTNDSPICEDGTVTVDVDDAPTASQYIWDVSWDGTADDEDVITAVSEVVIDMTGVAPGSYTVKVKARNGCGDSPWSITTTVVVAQVPDASASTNNTPSICSGEETDIVFDSDIPATGTWTVTNAGSTGATGGSGLADGNSIEQTLTNLGTTPVTVTYSLYPIGTAPPNCVGPTETFNVTVNPIPTLTSSLTPPAICSGDAFSYTPTSATPGTSFSWDRASIAGITPAGPTSGTGNPNETLTNTTANPINVVYVFTLTANGCSNTQNVTVTVNPTPTLTTTLTPPAICSGDAFSYTPASATAGTTFDWERATVAGITPAGPTSGTGNPNETLTNTTANPIDVVYEYTLSANGCSNTQNVTVTVNPTPTLNSDLTPPDICDGETFNYAPTSATAGTTFSWDRATVTGITPAGTSGTDDPNEALNNTSDLPINVVYEYTLTANGCSNTQDVTVTVNPTPTLSSTLTPAAICSGDAFSYAPTSDTPGTTFTWTRATVAGITPVGPTSGNDNPNETLINTTTNPLTVEYEYTLTANGCSNTQTVTVTVNPTPTLTSTLTPADLCDGETFNYTPTSATAGTSFSWNRADVPGITPAGPASGTGDPNETLINTTANPVNVVYEYTLTANGCSNTQNVTVTVNPTPTLSSSLTPPAICNNTAFSYTPTSNTTGTTFSWTRATVAGITPAGPTSGTNNPNETLVNTTDSPIPVEYEYTLSANGCSNTQTVTVVVNPTPELSSTLTPPAICSEETFNYTPTSTTAGTSFSWTRIATAGITPAGPTSGTDDPNEILVNTTFNPINVTYQYTLTANGCSNTQNVVVTVNPTPNATPTPLTQTIANADQTDILMDGDVAGTTFSWRVINAGATNATDGGPLNIGDRIQQTLSNNTTAPVTVTYRIGPSANGCPGDSADAEVTVDPNVDMTVVNNSPNICTGSNTDIEVSSNVAGATFSWTAIDPRNLGGNDGTNVGPYTGITIQDNLVNTSTETDSVIYEITPTGPAPTFISGTTQYVTVYVYPEPTALPVNHLDSICDGTQTDIEMAADVKGSTFTWIVNDPSGTSGATPSGSAVAEGYRITQTLDNPGNAPITVSYIITPTGPALGSCPGDPVTVEVVVDPTPVANITNTTPEICSEETTDITMNASVANSEFTWIMADPKGTGAVDGAGITGDRISQQLFNTTQTPVNIIWEIRVNGPGTTACPGTPVFEDVTVNPLPNTTPITGVDTVCEQTPNIIFQTDVQADSYFEWNVPASLGTRIFGGSGTGSNAVVITAADIPGPGYVTDSLWVFETNVYGCTDDTLYKPLTLIPYPVPSVIAGDDVVCAYSTHTYSVPDNPGSTYQWFIPPGAGFLTDPTLNTVDVTFGLLGGQVRVSETTQGGCNTEHIVKNITVNQLPVSTLNVDKPAICTGELVTFTAGPIAGVSNYEFFLNGISQQSGASNTWSSATLSNDDTVTVNITSTAGCEAFAPPVIMTVNPDPTVTLTSSAAANTICAGESVTFEATSADAVLYNFFLNGVSQQSGPLYFWTTSPGAITDGDEVYVEVQNASGCHGASDTITTTVNPVPIASIDGDHTVCPGTTVDIAVTITTGAGPYSITIDNGIGTLPGYLDGTAIPVTPATSTTYSLVEITDANGCTSTPGPNITGTAVVTHFDTVQILTQPKPAEVCEGIDTSFTVGAIGAGRTYEWFSSETETGIYTAIPSSNSPTLDIVAPTAALDGYFYYVVVSGTCDSEISDTIQLTIQYDPVSARDPFDAAVCEDLPTGFGVDAGVTENPVFRWYLSTDNGTSWAPLLDTAVYTGSSTDSLNISSASSRFNGYQYYVEINGNCGGTASSLPATLTVYERPEILEQPADTTVCEGNPVTFEINPGGTTNATFQWQVDMRGGAGWEVIGEDSAGIYSGFDQSALQVLNPTSRFDQYRYRVIVSGTCTPPQTSGFATLTVNEVAEIITPPSSKIICEEQSTVFSVNAGVTSAPSYLWEVDRGGVWTTIGADTAVYSGHNTSTLILSTVPSSYNGYRYRVTVGGACPDTETSPGVLLTVNQLPEILTHPADETVCENDPAQFTVDPGVTTTPSYQWQVNQFGAWVNLTAADETSGDYTGVNDQTLFVNNPDISYNNYRYRVIVSGTCAPPVTSEYATLTIDSRPVVLVDPVDMSVCEDSDVMLFVNAGPTTNPGYHWEYSSDGGTGWNDAAALPEVTVSDNDTIQISAIPAAYDGYLFRALVSGKCPAALPSSAAMITIFEKPEIAAHPVDVSACEQDTVIFTVDPGLTTAPAFQWQYYNGVSWFNVAAPIYEGANNDTLQINGVNSSINGTRYRVVVSGTCAPDSISEEAELTVDERPEILGAPLDQTICEGDDASFGISTGATTAPSVAWEYFDGSSWNSATGGIFSTNAAGDTLLLTTAGAGYDGSMYRAIVSNGCGPNDTSLVATLTVKNRPAILIPPSDAVVCEGLSTLFGMDAGITSDPVYLWEVNDGVSGWNPVFGAQYAGTGTDTLELLAVNSSMDGNQYRVILGGYCIPNDTSAAVTLTVTENAEITDQPFNAALCEGGDTLFAASAGVTTNPQYQWYVDDNSGGGFAPVPNAGVYSGANDSALVITGATFSMDGYLYQLEVTGDCGAPEYSNVVELTVYKAPEIVMQPQDTATCELKNVSFTIDVGATTAPMIQWYENNGTGMMPLSEGGGYVGTNSATLQIFGVDSAMTGYTYEARVTNGCGGPLVSDPAMLTVYVAPQIWSQPGNATICEGENTAFTVVATGHNLDYEWFVDDGSSTVSITDGGIYTGQGTATLQITGADRSHHLNRYYVRVTGDCQPWVQSDIAFLYVNNPPEIQLEPENDTICEFGTATFSVNATGGGLSYQWYESTDNGASFNPLSDAGYYIGTQLSTLTIFNVDRTYDTNQYRVIVSGTCTPDQQSVDVSLTVQTPPEVTTAPANVGVCDGEPAVFSVVAEGSDLSYQWKVNRNDGSGYVNIPDTDTDYTGALTPVLTKLTTDAATENGYSFRVQVTGPCSPSQLTDPVFLNVNSLPQINVQPVDAAVCAGGTTQFSASASGPDLNYQWMVSTDGGNNWSALANVGVYDGAFSEQLSINNTTVAMNGYRYRLDVSSSCAPTESDVVELTVWENPTASITGDLGSFPQLCGGELLTMDGNPVGGSGVYTMHLWSGDVLHVSPTNQRTATFSTHVKGDYNINYTVTDDNGCIGQASVVIQNFRPMAQFTSDATPKCGNLTVNFTNQSSADAVSFAWDFDNGATSTDIDPVQSFDNFNPSGMVAYYNVRMVAMDAQGCSDTAQSVVTIYPKVDPEITATPQSGCQPLEVLLETRPGAAAYLWDYGDGTGENGSYTSYHVYSNLGNATRTYKTVLQTTSAYGCVATDTIDIVVDPIPQPNFAASPDIQTIPETGSALVTFTNLTADGPWTFEYDYGDGSANYTTTSFADVEHTYTAAGIYTVTLYTNVGPCIDSASTVVTINPRPPVAGFTSITEGCHPLEIAFTNTSKNADSYTWQFGDGSISTETNPVHVFYQPGVYTVKLIANGPGGTDQSSVEITVNPTPQVFFNYAPDSVFVNDKPVRFFNLTSYADEYYWDFGDVSEFDGEVDSENNSTLADPLHVYMFEGWKDVLLIASNPYCTDSLFIPMAVKVIPAGELRFPNIFRPGDSPVTGVNVNNLSDAERNTVFFPGVNKQVQEYRLYIYNRWGELIFESDDINTGWDGFIQGRKAAQGVYIWKVTGIYSNGSPFSDAGDVTLVWQ